MVLAELALGVELAGGVVEVDVALLVEPRVLARPQRVERRGAVVGGPGLAERRGRRLAGGLELLRHGSRLPPPTGFDHPGPAVAPLAIPAIATPGAFLAVVVLSRHALGR